MCFLIILCYRQRIYKEIQGQYVISLNEQLISGRTEIMYKWLQIKSRFSTSEFVMYISSKKCIIDPVMLNLFSAYNNFLMINFCDIILWLKTCKYFCLVLCLFWWFKNLQKSKILTYVVLKAKLKSNVLKFSVLESQLHYNSCLSQVRIINNV